MNYGKWIKEGVSKPGKSAIGLAKVLGLHRSAVYKMMAGSRPVPLNELPAIATYIGESIPSPIAGAAAFSADLVSIEVERELNIGVWTESGQHHERPISTIVVPRDPEFPLAQHHAYLFKGDSMNEAAILDGDTIICVAFEDTDSALTDGKQVVIERNRGGLVEMSVRIVMAVGDHIEFVAKSSNKSYKPVVMDKKGKSIGDNERITVVSVVRRVTRFVR